MQCDRLGGDLGGLENPALNRHRIDARRHRTKSVGVNRLGQHGRGGGAVAGDVAGLAGHHVHELGAHVFERLGKLDLLGDGDAVLGDARASVGFLEHDVASARAERGLDRAGKLRQAVGDFRPGVAVELHLFGCHESF